MTVIPFPGTGRPADLTTCDIEPIHIIGRIQSFGYLLSCSPDWFVNHVSANCTGLFDAAAEAMVGSPVAQFIAAQALHDIRSRLQLLATADSVERLFELDLRGDGTLYDVAAHRSGRSYILEFEPSESGRRQDVVSRVRPMIDRLRQTSSVQKLCDTAVRQVRAMTTFARVMVYRFEASGAGEVIAESVASGIDAYKGQHFPAADIPVQARALYARNILRIISDIDDPTVPIVPTTNPHGEPLDLSMSGLRAVSPIHIEYLGNMGVKASMSISIMRRGQLWGLIACHHHAPLHLSYSLRTSAELFGEFFAYLLDQAESEAARQLRERSVQLHDQIMMRVADGRPLLAAFEEFADTIATVIPFDGIVGWVNGEFMSQGRAPDRKQFSQLARFLNTLGDNVVWSTDRLGELFAPAKAFGTDCAGLLSLPVSRAPGDYIVLFRKEYVHDVQWAGHPHKVMEHGPLGPRLTPRKSFDLWKEERHGQSLPWLADEVATAESLRVTLLEVVLRLADSAHREREQANRRQQILIAELNHRIRNILNLIRGLIAQSKDGSSTVEDFAELVGSRIHALARAHDQLTRQSYEPASLQRLIQTECAAYAQDRASRIVLSGPDAMIVPTAFTPLALVVHELMTNSCKYGALSADGGQVAVAMRRDADNALVIDWRESGGPPVSPPQRRGFGSTIIERTIPHELGGEADVDYRPAGLAARFLLPEDQIASYAEPTAPLLPRKEEPLATLPPLPQLTGGALVVEDNVIIAMEAEDILRELGCDECHVVGSVKAAMQVLDEHEVAFALLDIDLGSETSEPIAHRLRDQGTPFLFASGYGEFPELDAALVGVPVIVKPYGKKDLAAGIGRLGLG